MTALELTPGEHQHSALVEEAARHLSEFIVFPVPVIPYIRGRYDLSPSEACEVIRLARLYQTRRAAAS